MSDTGSRRFGLEDFATDSLVPKADGEWVSYEDAEQMRIRAEALETALRRIVAAAAFDPPRGPEKSTAEVERWWIDRDTEWMNAVRDARAALTSEATEPERVSDADYPVQIAPEYPEVEIDARER